MANIATQKDQLWSADGLGFPASYYFVAKSGGDVAAETSEIYDGGRTESESLFLNATVTDIVLTGLYRSADHATILRDLKKKTGRLKATLKCLDCDADKTPIGTVETFANCTLKVVKVPEHDSNSTSEAKFELTFSVPSPK